MKIKLLVSRAGAFGAQNAGEVIDVPDAEAARMIAAGQAQPVRRSKPERAVPKASPEKAAE